MSSAWFEVQILELLPFHSHSNMADNPAFSFNDEESVNDSKNSVKQLALWSEGGITLHISTELADMSSSASSPDLTNEYEAMHAINSLHTPKSSKAPALAISSQTNNLEADLYQSVTRETNDDSPMQVLAPQSLGETQYLNVPGHNFTTFLPETVEDGCTVISLQVPTLPRAHSAPDLSASATSDDQKLSTSTTDTSSPKKEEKLKMEMTKEELIKTYRLHVFVFLIFVVMVISLSLSWYYKQIANDILLANQNIFFDPATRTLTVLDPGHILKVTAKLGLEIPSWMLPLHCPLVVKDNPKIKQCIWKNRAKLTIQNVARSDVNCYNVSWESLQMQYFPHDCIDLGTAVWYGPSNQSFSTFPIRGTFQFQPSDYTVQNNGLFSSRLDLYWLSSNAAGLYVSPESPVTVFWNISGNQQLCLVSNFSGPFYPSQERLPYLNYTLCQSNQVMLTHTVMQSMFQSKPSINVSSDAMFSSPFWSLKGFSNSLNVTDELIKNLTKDAEENDFQVHKLSLDVEWERTTGDVNFDPSRFNKSYLEELTKQTNMQIILTISPYFKFSSSNFALGVINSTFVKDSGGVVPGLTLYDGQLTAILDVFNQQSVTWFTERLKELNDIGIENFRLTYGTQSWLPYKPRFQSTTGTPNLYRKLMTEAVSRVSKTLIVEHSSESRHVNSLVPLVAKIDLVDGRNCIVGVIDEALTLSIMGYPLVMVDGFKEMKGAKMTSEMYLRWYQLALTFPAYLITKPPWSVNKSLVHAVKQLSPKENILGDYLHQLTEEVLKGQPILRPVWWQDPNNASVHAMAIQDQFLIGEMFLIAPILCEGRYQRDVYIPPGIWESEDRIILGPKVLTDFPVPLDKIVIFKQRKEK